MTLKHSTSSMKIILAMASIYIIWGSTYLAIFFAVETMPPFLMIGVRFLTAGMIVFAWAWFRGASMPTRLHWRNAAIIGGLLLLAGNGSVAWAEQYVASGIAALVVATVPMWLVLLDWILLKNPRPRPRTFAGLLLGFGGIALLSIQSNGDQAHAVDTVGIIVLLLASFAWALGSIYSKKAVLPENSLMSISIQMIAGGVLLLVGGTLGGEWTNFDIAAVSWQSFSALVYLITFGSIIGFSCYLWLIRVAPAEMVGTYAYVNPVVAVFLGWWLANEAITAQTLMASAVIILAVVIITGKKTARQPRRQRPRRRSFTRRLTEPLVEPWVPGESWRAPRAANSANTLSGREECC